MRSLAHAVRLTYRSASAPVWAGLVAALLAAGSPVAVAWLTKTAIDGVVAGESTGRLVRLAIGLGCAGLLTAVLPLITEYLRDEVGRRTARAALDELHRAVGRFVGLTRFEDPRFLDRLRMAVDGERSAAEVVSASVGTGQATLMLVGFVGSLAVLSPTMTVVVVLAAVPTLVAELILSRRRADMLWEIGPGVRREFFYSRLLTTVDAAKEIRLFDVGAFLRGRMLTEREAADERRRRTDAREVLAQSGLALLGAAVAAGGLVWAVAAARNGALSVGDIAMFVAALAGVQGALATLVFQIAAGHRELLAFGHHRFVVGSATDLPVPGSPLPVPPLRSGIELRDVWFRYGGGRPWVLRGVNLTVPRGAAVGLVGLNGAGKSTLVRLLCRFYDPDRGAILWDGVDIRRFDPAALRARLTAVFQDHMAYDLTATENVALGDLTALDDPARIRAATERAGVADTIDRLPKGFGTMLSRTYATEEEKNDPDTGLVLSGGQWQRLALARALLRDDRDLMILDEPSSGLDAEAEYEIHQRLREYRRDRTSLLISHRLSTLRAADHIVVLDDGVVAEAGTHQELVAHDGIYARLFDLQAAGYRDDPIDVTRTAVGSGTGVDA